MTQQEQMDIDMIKRDPNDLNDHVKVRKTRSFLAISLFNYSCRTMKVQSEKSIGWDTVTQPSVSLKTN